MDDGVPPRALAAELVGIYRDAPTLEDEEYAAQAIDDLLDSLDDDSDDEVLVALLDLPETELTASLVDDVVSMLADTGSRVVERLLDLALSGAEPTASRALDALERMDDDAAADGLYEVLADGGSDLRRAAADGLVALGHAGAARLQDAYGDPWMSRLAQTAVEGGAGRIGAAIREGPDPGGEKAAGDEFEGAPAEDAGATPADDAEAAPVDESGTPPFDESAEAVADVPEASPPGRYVTCLDESVEEPNRPAAPDEAVLETEYRAFLERFERESGA